MNRPLTNEEARVLQTIIDDAVMRMDALAERSGHDIGHMRATAAGGLVYKALKAGQCKNELLGKLEVFLQGRCSCEMKTEGSA